MNIPRASNVHYRRRLYLYIKLAMLACQFIQNVKAFSILGSFYISFSFILYMQYVLYFISYSRIVVYLKLTYMPLMQQRFNSTRGNFGRPHFTRWVFYRK